MCVGGGESSMFVYLFNYFVCVAEGSERDAMTCASRRTTCRVISLLPCGLLRLNAGFQP